jgi:putative Ca2+/H+ antiporter (TMEM165/GDT1 family)
MQTVLRPDVITLATVSNRFGVTVGAIMGHLLCTVADVWEGAHYPSYTSLSF